MSINVGEVELQDPTSSSAPPQRSTRTAKLSFAQIAKLKLRASELALSARVDAALNEKKIFTTCLESGGVSGDCVWLFLSQ